MREPTVVGIDEVGRGSWAGPLLVVAARAKTQLSIALKDSKILGAKQREELFSSIVDTCDLGEGWVHPDEIDEFGLSKAMKLGVSRALINLGSKFDESIIIDGTVNYCPSEYSNVLAQAKADVLVPIVSAASIYAKVLRDRHMIRSAKFYPFYGFEHHVGYGTALHQEMLKTYGVSRIHRKSFKPIQAMLN